MGAGGRMTGSAGELLETLPAWATLVRAPNPGPMTLTGTNSWVLRAPGAAGCVVVDPGPLDEGHLDDLAGSGPVELILVTHSHPDHIEGVGRLVELTGARVLVAADEAEETLAVAGLSIRVLRTPGHTADSFSFVVDDEAVLTGDTILGQGSAIVAFPDGSLRDYLASLTRLAGLGPIPALPGHGPALADVSRAAEFYRAHRLARLEQVAAAVANGAKSPEEVVAIVYADLPDHLRWAAELTVRAQLDYLGPAR